MNPLPYDYFIDKTSSEKNMIKVLNLLHELGIISRSQLLLLLNINASVAERTMNQILKYLKDNNLIDEIKKGNQAYYFLTKEGHQSISGYYTLSKVPEYNLQHHL